MYDTFGWLTTRKKKPDEEDPHHSIVDGVSLSNNALTSLAGLTTALGPFLALHDCRMLQYLDVSCNNLASLFVPADSSGAPRSGAFHCSTLLMAFKIFLSQKRQRACRSTLDLRFRQRRRGYSPACMLSRRFAPALTTALLRPGSPRADSPSSRGVSVLKAAPNLHTLMLHVNMLTDPSELDAIAELSVLRNLSLHGNPLEERKLIVDGLAVGYRVRTRPIRPAFAWLLSRLAGGHSCR